MDEPVTRKHVSKIPARPGVVGTLVAFAAVGIAFSGDAHAYLDPGTGSILLQGLIASVAGGLILARAYWSRLKNFYKRSPQAKPELSEEQGDEEANRSDEG